MKRQKRLSSLLVGILCTSMTISASAQILHNDSTICNTQEYCLQDLNRDHSIFMQLYAPTPSLLKQWCFNEFSMVSFGYNVNKNDFHPVTLPSSRNNMTLSTENMLTLKGGWHLFGRFTYINGSADNTEYNLHLDKPNNGSPVYYFTPISGDWDFQKYNFEAYISKVLNDKWSMGATINYLGDLRFRTVDTRIDITELKMKLGPSISYKIANNQNINFSYVFNRRKGQPQINNKYQHTGNTTDYNIYINMGYGTYIKNASIATQWVDMAHQFTLGWDNHTDNNIYNTSYTFTTGHEHWIRTTVDYQTDTGENISEYNYTKHEIKLNAIMKLENENRLINFINFSYLSGENKMSEHSVYTSSFKVTEITAQAQSTYFWSNTPWLNKAQLHFDLDHYNGQDQKYGQKFTYTNLDSWASISFGHKIGKKNKKLNLNFAAGYKANLSYEHNAFAASDNIFTSNIITSLIAYDTANLLHGQVSLDYFIPLKKFNIQCSAKYGIYDAISTNEIDLKGTALENGKNHIYSFNLYFFF
ncbi:MAG: DUF6850 family outer membrane beta-barrel protein [Bacteroidales bacterium]